MIPNVLSIAGSDPSGGAGIQADLKTFSALGCYGMAALTALTAQNTRGVTAVHVPPAAFLAAQIEAVFADVDVAAVKIGMLATGEIARIVASRLTSHPNIPVVLDPVLVATSGDSLGDPDVVGALRDHLLPLATVITPNLPEAARLADLPVAEDEDAMRATAEALHRRGARAVLIKGGHLPGGTPSTFCRTEPISSSSAQHASKRATHMARVARYRPRSRPIWPAASPWPMRSGPRKSI